MMAIGVGCFWFADPKGEPKNYSDFSPANHIKEIQTALEGIDIISNLKVSRSGESYYVDGDSFSNNDEEGENYFPLLGRVSIQIDIFMPDRVQQKYVLGRFYDHGIENFHVRIIYDGGLPVVYIYYDVLGDESECDNYSPSSAVIFVREYLEEKLKEHPRIQFQALGPSPFHADFFIAENRNQTSDAISKDLSLAGFGYKTFYFEFPVDEDSLVGSFVEYHHQIFSAYYKVIRYRNRSLRLGQKILDGTQLLISDSSSQGLRKFRRWFQQGPVIDDVYKSILDQKLNSIELSNYLSSRKAAEEISHSNMIYLLIEREANDSFEIPTDNVKDILKVLEDRRQGYIRNSTTIVAGLIGGILGATLTFLLGSHPAASKQVEIQPTVISAPPASPKSQ